MKDFRDIDDRMEEFLENCIIEFASRDGQDGLTGFCAISEYDIPGKVYEEYNEDIKKIRAKIIDILHFIHIRKPAFQQYIDILQKNLSAKYETSKERLVDESDEKKAFMKAMEVLSQSFYSDQTKMLQTIVEIRGYLWT
jgi:hypothetical protein